MERISHRTAKSEAGFSLVEIIMSIVLIGIAVPTFSNYFGGLGDSKEPEYFTEAVFLATRQMQGLRNETLSRMPPGGHFPLCNDFRIAAVGAPFNIDCTSPDYEFSWLVEEVLAGDPNTPAAGTFGKKVTLTVSRTAAGSMASFQLVNLF